MAAGSTHDICYITQHDEMSDMIEHLLLEVFYESLDN